MFKGIVALDFDGLIGDVGMHLAALFNNEEKYQKCLKYGVDRTAHEGVKELKGYKINEIEKLLKDLEPYPFSLELLNLLHKKNDMYIISDDPLLKQYENLIKRKYNLNGSDRILTTMNAEVNNDIFTGKLKNSDKKENIIEKIHKTGKLCLFMAQGKNDIEAAKKAKSLNIPVIGINSDSERIKEISDYCFQNLEQFYSELKNGNSIF